METRQITIDVPEKVLLAEKTDGNTSAKYNSQVPEYCQSFRATPRVGESESQRDSGY